MEADSVTFDGPARLDASSLEVWRGRRQLVADFGFALEGGELAHLSGANGSGKTSLIRVLLGLTRPEQGEIRWCGQSIYKADAGYRDASAYVGHSGGTTANLSAAENLRYAASLMAARPRLAIGPALSRVGLAHIGERPAATLSAGQRRRLALARLLMSPARLWFLDEPLTSLDRAGVELVGSLVREHLSAGGMAVVATHQPLDSGRHPVVTMALGDAE